MLYQYYIRSHRASTISTEKRKKNQVPPHVSISLQIDNEQKQIKQGVPQLAEDDELSSKTFVQHLFSWIVNYFTKLCGLNEARPKRIAWSEYIFSFIGAFIGILIIASVHYHLLVS